MVAKKLSPSLLPPRRPTIRTMLRVLSKKALLLRMLFTNKLQSLPLHKNKLRLKRLEVSCKRKKRSELIKSFLVLKDEQELKN
jgi:hypothetical protein